MGQRSIYGSLDLATSWKAQENVTEAFTARVDKEKLKKIFLFI